MEYQDCSTCHTVKISRNTLKQGTAFCTCQSPSASLCKHIHAVCCWLSGSNPTTGGLAVFALDKTDFRQDRDPDEYDSDGDFDPVLPGEKHLLGPAGLVFATSDDDEPVEPSAAALFDSVALATALQPVETMLATLATKAQQDAFCDAVIYKMRERQRCLETTIKATQRHGRPLPKQTAAARPTSGPRPGTPFSDIQVLHAH